MQRRRHQVRVLASRVPQVIWLMIFCVLSGCSGPSYLVQRREYEAAQATGSPDVPAVRERDSQAVKLRLNRLRVAPSQQSVEPSSMRVTGRGTTHSTWITGAVLTSTGLALMGIGVGVAAGAYGTVCAAPCGTRDTAFGIGVALVPTGLFFLMIGIPTWIVGEVLAVPKEVH